MNEKTAITTQIEHFNNIAADNGFNGQPLASTTLSVTAKKHIYTPDQLSTTYETLWEELEKTLADTDTTQGWARSQKEIHAPWDNTYAVDKHGYLLEGEWLINKQTSIHLRQIHHGWVVTHYQEGDNTTGEPMLCQEQYLLNNAKNKEDSPHLQYRIYYQLAEHSYQSAFSRFVGFSDNKKEGA
ncbi:MAG: hypothetical protein KBT50_05070 [Cycloclasticus sp.]|nr:hypothetical protein [Cycloclasticus sp.]MBQ0789973.1 hypothetical protein [Cycloclasticus sp.]